MSREGAGSQSLTPHQVEQWLLHRTVRDLPPISGAAWVPGPLDEAALRRRVRDLTRRHSILRTTFGASGGRPVQTAGDAVDVEVTHRAVAGAADLWAERQGNTLRPVEPEDGPPWRVRALDVGHAGHILLVAAHPLVADDESVRQMLADLSGRRPGSASDFLQGRRVREQEVGAERIRALGRHWHGVLTGARATGARPGPSTDVSTVVLARGLSLPGANLPTAADAAAVHLACLAAALRLLTGRNATTIQVPVDTRSRAEGGAVGPHTSAAPFDLVFVPDEPLDEAVRRLDEGLAAVRAALPLPLADLVAGAGLRRPPAARGVCIGYTPTAGPLGEIGGVEERPLPVWRSRSTLDLEVRIATDGTGGLVLGCEYRMASVDRRTATDLLDRLGDCLRRAATDPAAPLGTATARSERRGGAPPWVAARRDPADVVAVVAQAARRGGDRTAVVDPAGHDRTYAELITEARRAAERLCAAGGRPGDLVAVHLPRGGNWIVAVLAVFLAGAAMLPLDPALPAGRRRALLEDAGAELVVGSGDDLDGTAVTIVGTAAEPASGAPPNLSVSAAGPNDIAYVLPTSGSTGRPKLVAITHRAFANQVAWLAATVPVGPTGRTLFAYPVGFDPALSSVFGTLAAGGTVVVAPPGAERDLGSLLALCRRHTVTALDLVPAQLDGLLRHPAFDGLPQVRRITCGGEALSAALALRCCARTTAELYNLYGLTETTINTTAYRVDPQEVRALGTVPIGRPVPGTVVRLLDRSGAPVPAGRTGEICVGGVQLAAGYLESGVPVHGALQLVVDPEGAGMLLRTGDLGRRTDEGLLLFEGRIDHQIQLHGRRVEPAEIETVLARHPAVDDCAVFAAPRSASDQVLTAVITYRGASAPTDREIRRHLAAHLPRELVPSRLAHVAELPRTGSGKLDRRALARLRGTPLRTLPGMARAATPAQQVVMSAMRDVLGCPPVAVDDDFFDLGGDSFSALDLVIELGRRCGRDVDVRDVLEAPTPLRLAERLETLLDLRHAPPLARGGATAGSRTMPAALSQLDVLADPRTSPTDPVHHHHLAVHLRGRVDEGALGRAIAQAVHRHGALRTSFARTPDGWRQTEHGQADPEVSFVSAASADVVDPLLAEAVARPFALTDAPLLRAVVVRVEHDHHVLGLVAHAAVTDRWALEILLRDVSRFYFHAVDGCELPRGLDLHFADYAVWLAEVARSAPLAEQRAGWRARLGAADPCRSGLGRRTFAAGVVRHEIEASAAKRLRLLADDAHVPLPTLLLAAFQHSVPGHAVAVRHDGRRGRPRLTDVVGPLSRWLPLPARPAGDLRERLVATHADLGAARSRHVALAAFEAADERVATYAHEPEPALRPGTLWLALHDPQATRTRHMLGLVTTEVDGLVRLTFRYSAELLTPGHVRGITCALSELLTGPDTPDPG